MNRLLGALRAFQRADRLARSLIMPHTLAPRLRSHLLQTLTRCGEAERVEQALAGMDAAERERGEIRIAEASLRLAGNDPEAATAMKIANNFVLGCAIEAMGEGFALTRKYGVPTGVFYDVMTDGLFNCSAYKVYGKIMVDESYAKVGQMAVLGLKDSNLALEAGGLVGVPLPSGNVWRDRLVGAVAHGDGNKDWAVMALEQARASGLAK